MPRRWRCEGRASIDGRGGTPLEPAMVRISGDRIEEVSTSLAVPPGATVIDLGAATLLPGLIDLHTHLTSREGVHWETALTTTTPPEAALWGARNARVTLMAGVTTCRDMGPNWPYRGRRAARCDRSGSRAGPADVRGGQLRVVNRRRRRRASVSMYVDVPIVRNLADGPDEVAKAVFRATPKPWPCWSHPTDRRSTCPRWRCMRTCSNQLRCPIQRRRRTHGQRSGGCGF